MSRPHRRARSAADRNGRLERRHEQGRRGRQGRKRLAWLAAAEDHRDVFDAGGGSRQRPRQPLACPRLGVAPGDRAARPGMATGIAAPPSTTGHGSVRKQSAECAIDSIAQSWAVLSDAAMPERADGSDGVLEQPTHPSRRWRGCFCLRLRSTTPRSIPAISRDIRPDCARTAGNIVTPRCGPFSPSRSSVKANRRVDLFSLLNPINHARTPEEVDRYKVEPYVVAADVYSVAPHVGRGGWTWYTGAAGWMYRAGIEGILGIRREGEDLADRSAHSRCVAGIRSLGERRIDAIPDSGDERLWRAS